MFKKFQDFRRVFTPHMYAVCFVSTLARGSSQRAGRAKERDGGANPPARALARSGSECAPAGLGALGAHGVAACHTVETK